MKILEEYVVFARAREIIYVKANGFATACKCGSRSFLSSSAFIGYVPKDSRIQTGTSM